MSAAMPRFSGDGMYVDNVLQYGNHKSRTAATGNNGSYTVRGNTLTASTEVGKSFRLGASAWSLEPQAQLIYQYSDFDNGHLDGVTQTKVKMDTADSFTARLGVRPSQTMTPTMANSSRTVGSTSGRD